jgi:hypothetical protein
MDIAAIKAFFMWSTIINAVFLALASLVICFFGDFSYRINSKWFSISRQTFDVICCSLIGLYKIFVLAFNLAPYIALVIIG